MRPTAAVAGRSMFRVHITVCVDRSVSTGLMSSAHAAAGARSPRWITGSHWIQREAYAVEINASILTDQELDSLNEVKTPPPRCPHALLHELGRPPMQQSRRLHVETSSSQTPDPA